MRVCTEINVLDALDCARSPFDCAFLVFILVEKLKANNRASVKSKMLSKNSILRKLRRDKDMTSKKVADVIGVKYATYNHYETGRINPPPDKLAKLAELFGVTTDYLLGRESSFMLKEDSLPYDSTPASLDFVGSHLAFREIILAVSDHPRKQKALRKLLEDFRAKLGGKT